MHLAPIVIDKRVHATILPVILAFCLEESVNQTDAIAYGVGKRFFTNYLYDSPERGRAKFKDRVKAIDANVIVKDLKANPAARGLLSASKRRTLMTTG